MAKKKVILPINDFSGSTNQGTASHLIKTNEFKLLVNVDQNELGAIGHRLGTELFLDLVSGAGSVLGLGAYEKADGTRFLHMVEAGNLRVSNESGGTWDEQETGVVSSSSTVEFVNFINRHYFIGNGATEYLRHATETGSSSVVSGNITGEYLAANGPYLMVVDPANQKAYWSGVGTDTFDTGTDFVNLPGFATGVGSFGSGRPFVVFTDKGYLTIDPSNGGSNDEVVGFGAASHRSIQNLRGHLIYLGRDGFYLLPMNSTFPQEIGRPIRNELTKDAIFNQIDGDNWAATASAVIDNRYFCALRNLSGAVKGVTLSDVIVEYDLAQETWKVHTYTTGGLATSIVAFTNEDGDWDLYAGSIDNKAVYKLMVADKYTDSDSAGANSAVTSQIITKDHEFSGKGISPFEKLNVHGLHFRYRADSAITVKYSLNGNNTYTTLSTIPATTSGVDWEFAELAFVADQCKTMSLDLTCSGDFMIYAIGYEVQSTNVTGLAIN